MKTEMATRYELAEKAVWAKLEGWQKLAVTQDRAEKKTSSVSDHFAKQVIALAESISFAQKGAKPTKKELTAAQN